MSLRFSLLMIPALAIPLSHSARGEVFKALARDFCEVNHWPYPYACWDREAARAPFPAMIQNGWRRQNLLADGHFSANSGELSSAGRYRVRWILTEAPIQHRTIYVRQADTPEQTTERLNAIREYAAKVAPDAGPPSILETHLSPAGYPAGWPGAKDDSIARKFQSFVPDKIYLPERDSNGGSN